MSELTLQEIKDKLIQYGISINTPHLKDNERKNELLKRLNEYEELKLENKKEYNKNINLNENYNENKNEKLTYNISSVSDLSLTEIRSRLTMLGEVRID